MDDLTKVLITIGLFILGAGIGSFIGMLIYRIRHKKSLIGRSVCEKCDKNLSIIELIPILSWIFLRGKCKKCHKKLDKFIPIYEIATAVLFSGSFWVWTWGESVPIIEIIQFALWLTILTGLIALLFFDLRYKKLPNKIMFPTMAVSVIFFVITSVIIEQNSYSDALVTVVLAMLPIAGVYGLIYLVSRGKLVGFGDVKLGVIIGFLLVWQAGVAVLFLANILAFLVMLPQLILKKADANKNISFGPFLIIATTSVFFVVKLFVDLF